MDELLIDDVISQVEEEIVVVKNVTKNEEYRMLFNITDRQKKMIKAGGLLNLVKQK
jgi:aconitate hydratase